jgi:hypothetical protein
MSIVGATRLRLAGQVGAALLLLGVVIQVAAAQSEVVRTRLPHIADTAAPIPMMTSQADFVRSHVPAGATALYFTDDHEVASLFSYYLISYNLAPRNTVWWGVPAPQGHVADWWQDARGGSQGIRRLAATDRAAYVVFAGAQVPGDLHPRAEWTMQPGFSVAEL